VSFVLAIGALLAFCGQPGRQSAQRHGSYGEAPSWALQYVHFATTSARWAMAENEQTGNTELLTSNDRGRHWHRVTPSVVVAAQDAFNRASRHAFVQNHDQATMVAAPEVEPLNPFVLNSRDAWLPVLRSYGHLDQSSELYVYRTADSGKKWSLRGRFPGEGLGSLFFLSRSVGFIETDGAAAMGEDPAQIYTTHDGGKHWREVSAGPPLAGPGAQGGSPSAIGNYCDENGVTFASPRVGFATQYCYLGAALQRSGDGGHKWGYIGIGPGNGGGATYPPVFSSPETGSMVVDVDPVLLFATTTDGGRHWDLRHLPHGVARLVPADDLCLPGCLDVVSARTWVVGAGHELYTTTDAGRSWRASSSPLALTYVQPPSFLTNLQLDFLNAKVGWAYEGDIEGIWDAHTVVLWRTDDGGRHWSSYSLARPLRHGWWET
jgi:photosystem II stability/assembly factor-like uncharacterized protein